PGARRRLLRAEGGDDGRRREARDRSLARSHDRHRCRRRRLGPGPGELRHARHLSGTQGALREELPRGPAVRAGGDRSVCEGGEGQELPGARALLLTLQVIRTLPDLRLRLQDEASIALVPTMGNLHAGHRSLAELARVRGGCVVATIFVNRLQFEPGGDFDRYPRTLDRDLEMLERAGTHVVFAPDEREMYPGPQEIVVATPKVAETLEGEHRPGHFQGVTTVVAKLFNAV